MTTLNDTRAAHRPATVSTVDVFGVAWPAYKVHAVLVGLLAVAAVLLLGGSGVAAMWVSGIAALAVWWGERAAFGPRWDDRARDHHAHH